METRSSRKEATRRRVLEAARDLFETEGCARATVREIADRAQVSVGSVFTSFSSKTDILNHIMADRLDALHAELDRVAPRLRGSTVDRLCSIFAIHYAFENRRQRLFLAHIASAYTRTAGDTSRPYGRDPHLRRLIHDCLTDGMARGDVDPACDVDLVIDMLTAAYAWTYRMARDGADGAAMSAAMDLHIGVISRGFRAPGP